jgi:hypothetical protein
MPWNSSSVQPSSDHMAWTLPRHFPNFANAVVPEPPAVMSWYATLKAGDARRDFQFIVCRLTPEVVLVNPSHAYYWIVPFFPYLESNTFDLNLANKAMGTVIFRMEVVAHFIMDNIQPVPHWKKTMSLFFTKAELINTIGFLFGPYNHNVDYEDDDVQERLQNFIDLVSSKYRDAVEDYISNINAGYYTGQAGGFGCGAEDVVLEDPDKLISIVYLLDLSS